ncbi:MAG TPA: SLBB domain-containing protein, partial [Fimbriimonadaceae bacterium]|nr:SLBB domain-containing protein [Fimbriimonadaceae bacterium]
MRVLVALAGLLALSSINGDHPEPLRLKIGDTVEVTSAYGGVFPIMPDGAIYGRGFGRIVLSGLTWEQAQTTMRKALHRFVRDDEVNLSIKDIRRDVVYLVGMNGGKGPVDLAPNLTLRQLLSGAPLDENADQEEVQVFRKGAKVCDYNVANLLSGDPSTTDQVLVPDDVVTLQPVPFVRVWLTGFIDKTGQLKVPAGTDVYRAIAQAGGIKWPDLEADTSLQQLGKIVVRRGPDSFDFPVRPDMKAKPFMVEAGDTITVIAPEERRITMAGEIDKPGEIVMRGEHSLTGAIAMAGGCGPEGTLANVLILRKGELYQIDATPPPGSKELPKFEVEAGDLVYVQRNIRAFVVLGEVSKPGRVFMKDGKTYRLSDALGEAGGLSERGTLRRVFISHPDASGKIVVTQYNLDEYLKDGTLASNPQILPGECILFGQPKGFTIASAAQVLSNALL